MSDQHNQHEPQHDPARHGIRLQSVWNPPLRGSKVWRRCFGRPAGIEPGMRVFLVIEEPAVAALVLNGAALPLSDTAGVRWTLDVTSLLQDRNEMLLTPVAKNDSLAPAAVNAHGRVSLPVAVGRVSLEILTPSRAER